MTKHSLVKILFFTFAVCFLTTQGNCGDTDDLEASPPRPGTQSTPENGHPGDAAPEKPWKGIVAIISVAPFYSLGMEYSEVANPLSALICAVLICSILKDQGGFMEKNFVQEGVFFASTYLFYQLGSTYPSISATAFGVICALLTCEILDEFLPTRIKSFF
jgi:hypothetical protein